MTKADAFKAGMRRAAEIAENFKFPTLYPSGPIEHFVNDKLMEVCKAMLAEAEQAK